MTIAAIQTRVSSSVSATGHFVSKNLGPISKSTMGKMALSAIAELSLSLVVANFTSSLAGRSFACIGRSPLLSSLSISSLLMGFSAVRTSVVAKTALTVMTLVVACGYADAFADQGEAFALAVGEQAGYIAGTIIGGYIGLCAAGADVRLWNAEEPSGCYSVSMLRYLAAGFLFDQVIRPPDYLILKIALIAPIKLSKLGCQTMAYTTPAWIPVATQAFHKKKGSANLIVPLLGEMLHNRFGLQDAAGMSRNISNLAVNSASRVSSSFPLFFRAVLFCDRQTVNLTEKLGSRLVPLILPYFNEGVKLVRPTLEAGLETLLRPALNQYGQAEKCLPVLIMESLRSYLQIVKQLDIKASDTAEYCKQLDLALNSQIQAPTLVDRLLLPTLENLFVKWADSIVNAKEGFDIGFCGFSLTSDQSPYLKQVLPIYLKYYFLHAFCNASKIDAMTPTDEQTFLLDLNYLFFSFNVRSNCPPWMTTLIYETFKTAINTVGIVLFPPEQTKVAPMQLNVVCDYAASSPIDEVEREYRNISVDEAKTIPLEPVSKRPDMPVDDLPPYDPTRASRRVWRFSRSSRVSQGVQLFGTWYASATQPSKRSSVEEAKA